MGHERVTNRLHIQHASGHKRVAEIAGGIGAIQQTDLHHTAVIIEADRDSFNINHWQPRAGRSQFRFVEPTGIRIWSSNRHELHSTTTMSHMPSYRAILPIGDIRPGHHPEEVMDSAVAAVSSIATVEHTDIQILSNVP